MIEAIPKEQLPEYLAVLKQGYEKTAVEFGMTEENCPYRGRTRLPYPVFEKEFDDGCLVYGYICDHKIVGSVPLSLTGHEMRINDVVVLPTHQNRGIGSALMRFPSRRRET